MTFGFIDIQYFSCFFRKCRVNLHQTFRYVLMYSGFRNAKLLCRLPDGGIILNDIISNTDCPFLDIILQKKSPQNTFLHCMKYREGL